MVLHHAVYISNPDLLPRQNNFRCGIHLILTNCRQLALSGKVNAHAVGFDHDWTKSGRETAGLAPLGAEPRSRCSWIRRVCPSRSQADARSGKPCLKSHDVGIHARPKGSPEEKPSAYSFATRLCLASLRAAEMARTAARKPALPYATTLADRTPGDPPPVTRTSRAPAAVSSPSRLESTSAPMPSAVLSTTKSA